MGSAIWLLRAVPEWYFETLLDPLGAGPFSGIPALGALALIAGLVLAAMRRRKGLLLFLVPFAASEALVALAGAMRGRVGPSPAGWITLVFLAAQLLFCLWLLWRLRGARAPAAAFTLFSLTYALFAAFVAGMAFGDTWM
jgi:hypothetical protein